MEDFFQFEILKPIHIIIVILTYFAALMVISYFTSKDTDNEDFFVAGRKSPWYLVAFGMIGASLSGVTFISVPGEVGFFNEDTIPNLFAYMQMVFGFFFGYMFIAFVLMPMYYRMQLTSIYTYLQKRFGNVSHKTGATFFLISRTIGASFRLYLVAIVLQRIVMDYYHIPFPITILISIAFIWIYTYRGGIKTIVWTDTLQTLSMLIAVVLTIVFIGQILDASFGEMITKVFSTEYEFSDKNGKYMANHSKIFFFDNFLSDGRHFVKFFLSGIFIAIAMTGLDQDMMQKNLSCRSLKDAQKNMVSFSVILIVINFIILFMGALLYVYIRDVGIEMPSRGDLTYSMIAIERLSPIAPIAGILFVIGLVAAAYSSADSALTSLTTSFCVDILGFEDKQNEDGTYNSTHPSLAFLDGKSLTYIRTLSHILFSFLLFLVILIFWFINDKSVIKQIFTVAGYTYGPLLGLYFFGFFTKQMVRDKWVWLVCVLAPILSFLIKTLLESDLIGYKVSFELLLINGLLTFVGLLFISNYDEDVDINQILGVEIDDTNS